MGLESHNNHKMVMTDIAAAQWGALEKHGPLTTDPVRACAIMLREGGEAMNEALLMTKPDAVARAKERHLLYVELAQTAATCAIIMENLRREGI